MEPIKVSKQMVEFQKATFDNSFNAMVMVQEQGEKMIKMLLDQATWLPEEGRKLIEQWLESYKKGREDFKRIADDNYRQVENFFSGKEKTKQKK